MEIIDNNISTLDVPRDPNTTIDSMHELSQINTLEDALEGLIAKVETLARKELETLEKIKQKDALIFSMQQENVALKEENEKLQSLLKDYMGNFTCFNNNNKESFIEEKVNETITLEQRLDEMNQKVLQVETEKTVLHERNNALMLKNEYLTDKVETLNGDIKKLNDYILISFDDTLNGKKIESKLSGKSPRKPRKAPNSETKKGRKKNKDIKEKEKDEESPKVSPIAKKLRNVRKNYTDTSANEFDIGSEFDEDINPEEFSEEESFGEDEYEVTPKKGGRKKSATIAVAKKAQPNKKLKKTENKELLAANRNSIQYHLFG